MYSDHTDNRHYNDDPDIATRVPMGNGFSETKTRQSGSRYMDKRIRDAAGQHASGSGDHGKNRGSNRSRLFIFLTIILLVLILCAVAAIVLMQRQKNGAGQDGSGTLQNAAEGSLPENKAGDGTAGAGQDNMPGDAGQDGGSDAEDQDQAGAEEVTSSDDVQEGGSDEAQTQLVDLSILDSPYASLMDAQTGELLAVKRGDEKIFPASMTKMLTVITAIENIPDLDATIYMEEDFYEDLYDEDASRAGFEPGEEAVIRDLLYGALLPSGAECCIELARQAAGSESAFVDLMNQKVADLGLVQTHFTNCTGLHDTEQFSTCTEMAKILRSAMQNETFLDVFTTHRYSVNPTSIHPEGFTFWSTLFKATADEIVTGGEIIGGKTGFTDEAGHCLASAAEIYGEKYILVTAGWAEDPENELYHIDDAFRAYNALGSALSEENAG